MTKLNDKINYAQSFETIKNNIMKVTINRVLAPGELPCFEVRIGENLVKVFHYMSEVRQGSIYNEALNLADAIKLAKELEMGLPGKKTELIYESPNDIPEDTFIGAGVNNQQTF